jgi:tetratricopeptide (TPR) repeat protein
MTKLPIYIFLIFSFAVKGQNIELANSFFKDREYQKALLEYDKVLTRNTFRTDIFIKKIKCYQELEQYKNAEKELKARLKKIKKEPVIYIELGYNFTLQNDSLNANKAYNKSLEFVSKNPSYANVLGKSFQKYSLLSKAERTYKNAIETDRSLNFDYQLASIYGQKNEINKMFASYLNLMKNNKQNTSVIQNLMGNFLDDNPENENNIKLKKALLKKIQSTPNVLWNEQLSWLFTQENDFHKAFIQEKAIFKREGENLNRIFNLGELSKQKKDYKTAEKIFNFISLQPINNKTKIELTCLLLEIKEKNSSSSSHKLIVNQYKKALDSFGINNKTIKIQLAYANFLAFKDKNTNSAINFLENNENQSLSKFDKARYQMTQADILVASGQFNKALINYTKIQRDLKNNSLSQEARFKVAKTSYYKGDFNWALQQLNILKTSTSQLIANDALDLHLLISDNLIKDSTNIALKKYANAELLFYRKKNNGALIILNNIILSYPDNKIIDDALFLNATIYEIEEDYENAKKNYLRIIKDKKESVFVDDALFKLAAIELDRFNNKDNAVTHLENIIFNHADSIHFVEARKIYRKIRRNSDSTS